ncbi:hypothetical protein H671_3g9006 [Cricetulus griseus]|uniref:Uncharacterized protein n=1 Tax=Cricetulus griseus TaxID=10029 RepID=A0A061IDT9_CRIGR|nr:hypothetical protein H671_3g9006 [Cricetulus griseus]
MGKGCGDSYVPYKSSAKDENPLTQWQIDYIGPFPPCKWQFFLLTGVDTYFGYGFAIVASNASAKTTMCEFTEYLIQCHVGGKGQVCGILPAFSLLIDEYITPYSFALPIHETEDANNSELNSLELWVQDPTP